MPGSWVDGHATQISPLVTFAVHFWKISLITLRKFPIILIFNTQLRYLKSHILKINSFLYFLPLNILLVVIHNFDIEYLYYQSIPKNFYCNFFFNIWLFESHTYELISILIGLCLEIRICVIWMNSSTCWVFLCDLVWGQIFRWSVHSQRKWCCLSLAAVLYTYIYIHTAIRCLLFLFSTSFIPNIFKLYFIDYAITVVLIFAPLPPSSQHPPLSQAIPTPLFMFMGHVCKFFGYCISYTVLSIPVAIL